MKKALLGMIVLALMSTTGCKKNNSVSGTWTFEGTTYTAVPSSGSVDGSFLTASSFSSSDSATYGVVSIEFYGTSLPSSSGNYTVDAPYANSSNQLSISMTTNGVAPNTKTYQSSGASGNLTVKVSISGGKVSVSGSGVEMVNVNNPADSSALTFNITQ